MTSERDGTLPGFDAPGAQADLMEQLRGPEGSRVRADALGQLEALEGRLEVLRREGISPNRATALEAALLAVKSARSTLMAIEVGRDMRHPSR